MKSLHVNLFSADFSRLELLCLVAEAPNSRSKLFSPEDLCARSNFPGRKSGDGPRMAGPRVDRKKCDIKLKKSKTLNRLSRRKKGMASNPLDFFLHFPNELC